MRRIFALLGSLIVAGTALVACSQPAHADGYYWSCTAPGSGYTVTTTNFAYVRRLGAYGWHCDQYHWV